MSGTSASVAQAHQPDLVETGSVSEAELNRPVYRHSGEMVIVISILLVSAALCLISVFFPF